LLQEAGDRIHLALRQTCNDIGQPAFVSNGSENSVDQGSRALQIGGDDQNVSRGWSVRLVEQIL
jgi:hypothetical protein